MRLLDLSLSDFGVYQGVHTFKLATNRAPIVLLGGKNGAGKTTLLEAVQLCLYGSRALGHRVSRREYEEYLSQRFHRRRDTILSPHYTSVRLSFEYGQFGTLHNYEVLRDWKKKSSSISEELVVKKDGQLLQDVAEDRWQDFIDDILPPGITSLFFFDGEKIQSLALDRLSEQSLGKEIKQLLGLNLVEQLQNDLDVYLYQQREKRALTTLSQAVESAQQERNETQSAYQARLQDHSQTKTYIAHARGRIEDIERRISRESSGFALARDELKGELTRVESELAHTQRELHDLSAGLLPFALVPDLTQQLQDALLAEARQHQWQTSQELVESRLQDIRATYHADDFWKQLDTQLRPDDRRLIENHLDEMLGKLLRPSENLDRTSLLHHVSDQERIQLLSWIDQALHDIPQQAIRAGKRLEELTHQRDQINLSLHKVPQDDILKPLMEELNEWQRKLGELEARAARQEEELRASDYQRAEAVRKLQKAYEALRGGEALERRLSLVTGTQQVLGGFLEQLTRQKVAELGALVTARFKELSRKPDLVRKACIDPETFQFTLYGQDEKPVPKQRLSAGEKQMFAIAVLWALRQLSGRPFPIIIDTPLGRLDSDHRNNLAEKYFPYVSHQVILLSTDAEVDQAYFRVLAPNISHAYHLIYDPSSGATQVEPGYFWSTAKGL